jgi:hypothetical protein
MSVSSSKNFRVEGLNELNIFIKGFSPAVSKLFQTVGSKYAQSIVADMMKRVPVKTGHLKSTIGSSTSPNRIEFYVTADYAADVNYGTYRMPGRPFFTGPLAEQTPKMLQELDKEVDKYIATNLRKR